MKTDDGFFLAKMMSKSFITTFISINYTFLSKMINILSLVDKFTYLLFANLSKTDSK